MGKGPHAGGSVSNTYSNDSTQYNFLRTDRGEQQVAGKQFVCLDDQPIPGHDTQKHAQNHQNEPDKLRKTVLCAWRSHSSLLV
jgi:hypothetical protein